MSKSLIVTFTCSDNVHIYTDKCGVKPMLPYKLHSTIEGAKKHLKECGGIEEAKIIVK